MTETRIRVNAKITAKGFVQLDVTVELNNVQLKHEHPNVISEILNQEQVFRDNGKKMVGDE